MNPTLVPEAVRDILKEELALHGFDIKCWRGVVSLTHHNLIIKIKFINGDMEATLDLGGKSLGKCRILPPYTIALADPACFTKLADRIVTWVRDWHRS